MTGTKRNVVGIDTTVSPNRVAAGLAHNPNVRTAETTDDSVTLRLTNSGIGHTVLQHLRSFGYEVISISPRFGTVRCVPTAKPIVAPKHDSTAVQYHRHRLRGARLYD